MTITFWLKTRICHDVIPIRWYIRIKFFLITIRNDTKVHRKFEYSTVINNELSFFKLFFFSRFLSIRIDRFERFIFSIKFEFVNWAYFKYVILFTSDKNWFCDQASFFWWSQVKHAQIMLVRKIAWKNIGQTQLNICDYYFIFRFISFWTNEKFISKS